MIIAHHLGLLAPVIYVVRVIRLRIRLVLNSMRKVLSRWVVEHHSARLLPCVLEHGPQLTSLTICLCDWAICFRHARPIHAFLVRSIDLVDLDVLGGDAIRASLRIYLQMVSISGDFGVRIKIDASLPDSASGLLRLFLMIDV